MLFFFNYIRGLEYYLKEYDTERYITSEETNNKSPYLSEDAKPDLFEILENADGKYANTIKVLTADDNEDYADFNPVPHLNVSDRKIASEGHVMTVANFKNTVIYFPFYGGSRQFLYLEAEGYTRNKYRIMQKEQCIGYNEDFNVFEKVSCSEDDNVSWFELVSPRDYLF